MCATTELELLGTTIRMEKNNMLVTFSFHCVHSSPAAGLNYVLKKCYTAVSLRWHLKANTPTYHSDTSSQFWQATISLILLWIIVKDCYLSESSLGYNRQAHFQKFWEGTIPLWKIFSIFHPLIFTVSIATPCSNSTSRVITIITVISPLIVAYCHQLNFDSRLVTSCS